MDLPPRSAIDHSPGRPQHWSDVDPDIGRWVEGIDALIAESLPAVSAVYLHGSLAMGSYYRPKSDVDLLVVVDAIPKDPARRALAVGLLDAFDRRPIVGGVEMSVLHRRQAQAFVHPSPYEFHFSEKWVEDVRRGGSGPRGVDPDLAAHCTMAQRRGLALHGADATHVIGRVPSAAFLDSITDDFEWIVNGGILESPFYGVLNVCRVLQIVTGQPRLPPSKEEGARWALDALPVQHHQIIAESLECYRSATAAPVDERRVHGHRWDQQALVALAAYARRQLSAP